MSKKLSSEEMLALRGAYVTLWDEANDYRRSAEDHRQAAVECDLKAKRIEAMALAAADGWVALGGDQKLARNYYSWCYQLPEERKNG